MNSEDSDYYSEDSDDECPCLIPGKKVTPCLINRHTSRIHTFNELKKIKKLDFNDEANALFVKFLEFMFYQKTINYSYFIKKVCDLYNINFKCFRCSTNCSTNCSPDCFIDSQLKENYENIWNLFIDKNL